MEASSAEVDTLLAACSEPVRRLTLETRRWLRRHVKGVSEEVDAKARVIGYGIGAGYSGLVCTIILSRTGVKLGIVGGAALPDPDRLLEGTGKVHRYVPIADAATLRRPGLAALVDAAAAQVRAAGTEKGKPRGQRRA